MEPFWIDLYINPAKPPPNQAGTTWRALCKTAGCEQDRGILFVSPASLPYDPQTNTFVLTSEMRQDNPFVYRPRTQWDERLPAGDVELWAFIDSYGDNNNANGLIFERNEDNNRFGPYRVTVKPGWLATAGQPDFSAAADNVPPAIPLPAAIPEP
jgi:hypothetical protein